MAPPTPDSELHEAETGPVLVCTVSPAPPSQGQAQSFHQFRVGVANRTTASELRVLPSGGETKKPAFTHSTNMAPMLCQRCSGHQRVSSDQNRTPCPGRIYGVGGGWTGIKTNNLNKQISYTVHQNDKCYGEKKYIED